MVEFHVSTLTMREEYGSEFFVSSLKEHRMKAASVEWEDRLH